MYVFDNAAPLAESRLNALAQVFDPGTIRHLDARGVADGWRCLEVGGGLGSITRWLSQRVAPRGSVLTTDIDTRHLERLSLVNVEIQRHDIATDGLPEKVFDLAYARLVLEHVSDPVAALSRMAAALKPGGWLVVEDFEVLPGVHGLAEGPAERISKTAAVMRQVVAAAGTNTRWGRSLSANFLALGLAEVGTEGRAFVWRGGSAGAALMRLNCEQLRDAILATGQVTPEEFAADLAYLDNESFEARSPILWTAWGRCPTS